MQSRPWGRPATRNQAPVMRPPWRDRPDTIRTRHQRAATRSGDGGRWATKPYSSRAIREPLSGGRRQHWSTPRPDQMTKRSLCGRWAGRRLPNGRGAPPPHLTRRGGRGDPWPFAPWSCKGRTVVDATPVSSIGSQRRCGRARGSPARGGARSIRAGA